MLYDGPRRRPLPTTVSVGPLQLASDEVADPVQAAAYFQLKPTPPSILISLASESRTIHFVWELNYISLFPIPLPTYFSFDLRISVFSFIFSLIHQLTSVTTLSPASASAY